MVRGIINFFCTSSTHSQAASQLLRFFGRSLNFVDKVTEVRNNKRVDPGVTSDYHSGLKLGYRQFW